jgi:hypothetical protein
LVNVIFGRGCPFSIIFLPILIYTNSRYYTKNNTPLIFSDFIISILYIVPLFRSRVPAIAEMQSSTSTSASTNTQNKSTSSVQGATNNNNSNVTDPVAKLAASKSILAEDTRHKLEGIVKQLDEKTTNSKFLKIADGEEVCLLFDGEKVEHIVVTYPKKDEEEAEPKPVNRIKFILKQANGDGTVLADREEIEWTTSETTGKEILRWVLKGFLLLDVARRGSGKFDTKYTITPHI